MNVTFSIFAFKILYMSQIELMSTFRLSVDCAIFGYQDGEIKLLLHPNIFEPFQGKWSLVSGFLRGDENINEAAERIMLSRIGVDNVFLKEVSTFSETSRYPKVRVVSVLHYALVRVDELQYSRLESHGAQWFSLNEVPNLIMDHNVMVKRAYKQLQREANDQLLGKELLPPFFTMLQLRNVYNCIFQKEFDPANFRKKILSLGVLKKQPFKNKTESKKGAFYYSFDPAVKSYCADKIFSLK